MESQTRGPLHGGQADDEPKPPRWLGAGEDPNPATQAISVVEAANADAQPQGAAAASNPPQIPLAPLKRVQARFNPLADGLMYLVVFVGGFVGVGLRRVLDEMMPAAEGQPFVPGTFVSNMLACFLFAMLVEYMAVASWWPRRMRQIASRGIGLGMLGGLSTMSGLMLETMEGMSTHHVTGALLYLAISFVGGMIASVAGLGIMQLLLARRTRRAVREALRLSDSPESDNCAPVLTSWLSDSPESAIRTSDSPPCLSDSPESDIRNVVSTALLSDSPESDSPKNLRTPSHPEATGLSVTISPSSSRCSSGTTTSWMLSLPSSFARSPDSTRMSMVEVVRPSARNFARIASASVSFATTITSYR